MKRKKNNNFAQHDVVTGKKLGNPLNRKKLSKEVMDEMFLEV